MAALASVHLHKHHGVQIIAVMSITSAQSLQRRLVKAACDIRHVQEAWEEAAADEAAGEGWNAEDQAELDAFVPEQGQGDALAPSVLT